MEMKDIALMFCNLPEGNYKVKTKIGSVEVNSTWSIDKNLRIVNISIDGKIYDEITYIHYDSLKLSEKINFGNNDKPYELKHYFFEAQYDRIKYTNDNGNEYEITNNSITHRNKYIMTYSIENGICISPNKNIKFTYNLETDEKLLYIKRFDCEKENTNLNNDYVRIHAIEGYKLLILGFNNYVSSFKNNNLNIDNKKQKELADSIKTPTIDLNEVERLDKEIEEYVKICKEFLPKLTVHHSEEMFKILESVAIKLTNEYVNPKQDQKKKTKKFFELSKFKNN